MYTCMRACECVWGGGDLGKTNLEMMSLQNCKYCLFIQSSVYSWTATAVKSMRGKNVYPLFVVF